MQSPTHTRKYFDAELEHLCSRVLAMGGLVWQQIRYASRRCVPKMRR